MDATTLHEDGPVSLGPLDYMQPPLIAAPCPDDTLPEFDPVPPSPEDVAWKAGYDAGRAVTEQRVRDLEYTISRLEDMLADARCELIARGR